jgi:hypothetical protein
MCVQLTGTYLTLVDSLRMRLNEHSSILRPLLMCQQKFNTLCRLHAVSPCSPPPYVPLICSLSLAVQSLRDAIALCSACLLQLLAHPTPSSASASESGGDPVLHVLGGGWLLAELQAAQRVTADAIAAAAVL